MQAEAELTTLGLTTDEARCYLALLARGRLTATELSAVTGVTRGRIYEIVRALLSKGVAVEAATRVRSFEAVAGKVAVSNLLDRRRTELAGLETTASQLTELLDESAASSSEQVLPSLVDVLRHRATVRERCNQLEAAAQREILFFVRDMQQQAGADLLSETDALQRGVTLRALYESSLLQTAYRETIDRFLAAGGEGRHVPALPCRLTIIDREVTMMALQEPPAQTLEFTVLVFNHEGVGSLAAIAFESIWQTARPITADSGAVHAAC